MRRKRIVQAGKCYHLVSRVAHKAFFFDDEEKERFVDLLMRVEFFSCVKVLAYCCMSNHIHVFIFLEEGRDMSEDEILARVNALYRRSEIVKLHKAAISARIGEIDEAAASGGIVDWLFGMFGSGNGKKAEREKVMQKDPSELAGKYPMPQKYELALDVIDKVGPKYIGSSI